MSDSKNKEGDAGTWNQNKSMLSVTALESAPGSATGSLRNKHALKPGHSLMNWIRLCSSGIDLSGTKGAVFPVNHKELSEHNHRRDAWLAIRGKVFNVTRYLDFHPGGVDEIMRGAGKDSTKIFEDIHSWVNYDQLLAKCFIGPLTNGVQFPIAQKVASSSKQQQTAEINPRFDWIQKSTEISLNFYTKRFCNPGVILIPKNNKEFIFHILFESYSFEYNFKLQYEVGWPPNLANVTGETGKMEVRFTKIEEGLWTLYGTHTTVKISELRDSSFIFEVDKKIYINHDSFSVSLKSTERIIIIPPIGCHFSLTTIVDGKSVTRSYTPVPAQFITSTTPINALSLSLHFIIKTYEDGLFSKYIRESKTSTTIEISQPKRSFKLSKLSFCDHAVLIAAGSGITPMLSLIQHLLLRSSYIVENVILLLFNKTEEDIWCRQELNKICSKQFQLINILSQPTSNWRGKRGHISKELLEQILHTENSRQTFICICGPSQFTKSAKQILGGINFPDNNIHVFQDLL